MRRVVKSDDSRIIKEELFYKVQGDNSRLAELLKLEQNNICAYTDTYLGRADKKEIDHFNPLIKGTDQDNYTNWFLVKAQWNSEKSAKWAKYQPILLPTEEDFEQRILYFNGDYVLADSNDVKANNLIRLLKLDDPDLADQRKRYIKRLKEDIEVTGMENQDYVNSLLRSYHEGIYFIRAIESELDVIIDFDLIIEK